MDDHPFSEPHNWCDRRCQRCPLASECGVPRLELQQRASHEARGEEWDPLDAAVDEMCSSLTATIAELAPPDGDGSDEARPASPEARRLRDAAFDLMQAFAGAPRPELRSFAAAVIASTKVMRISTYLLMGASGSEVWRTDAVPNLLLLDRAKAELRRSLVGRRDRASRKAVGALDVLDEILAPLVAAIGPEPRRALRSLEDRGRAPSPFIASPGPAPATVVIH